MRFTGHATPPAGEPPELDVRSETESVTLEGGEGAGIDAVSYETHVTFTSEIAFTESGPRCRGPQRRRASDLYGRRGLHWGVGRSIDPPRRCDMADRPGRGNA